MLNIALLFASSVLLVRTGKAIGILMSPASMPIDIATGCIVTLMIVGIGALRRNELSAKGLGRLE